MSTPIEITTQRLLLRQWRDSDREPYAALCADPVVMRFFASTLSRAGSDRDIDAWRGDIDNRGWGNWAAQTRDSGTFIGYIGLSVPRRALPFMPCVELGYRLAEAHWGKGYATEGSKAVLRLGFERLGLEEIVSFTTRLNLPSRAVMERVGMVNANEDFDHPAYPEGSAMRRCCLYRLSRERWLRSEDAARGFD
ncbi:GNAT family N-acetyltransferase [Variovorax sp. J2P1-59]|uniref:GNAT family N-acetyltransferase n=1 Tax=Variovorax flavidus TaxID=3053501 RepID=UPI002574CCCC|nr:GNAT family N-acetyltransferase [Variovorax sp. J2P1-59]MDM0073773.1 GNAT family N-acetyltransferase [Variovorax sp. J2P1-59]